MAAPRDWYQILEVVRSLSGKSGKSFTAHDLTQAADLPQVQIASHWLYKFRKWGYVEVVGTAAGSGIRPLNVFEITDKGRECKARAGREAQLRRLAEAVRAFQKARRTPREESAYQVLIKLCDEVES
jgi:predicted ArsR family transcriptional regulator